MRISSAQIFNIANNSMADANEALIKTQEQLSTGQRVLTPADDPVASTKIMQLNSELAGIEQFNNNIDIAQNNLVLEESILGSINGLIQRMQEIAVQAGNTATLSENEYSALASEVDSRLDELFNLVNTQNANGDYIFGGYRSRQQPFVGDSLTGFQYQGNDGQQFIKVANNTNVATNDSGKNLFVDIQSSENTVTTYASPSNQSNPPVQISIGTVVNQVTYDDFYPEDMVITFNADSNLTPATKNYTVTEKSTGRVIVADQPYISGNPIEIQGVSFRISGSPVSGVAATPATRLFGADSAASFPTDFTATPATFNMTVNGQTETFTLDANVASTADLSTILNSAANGNAAALARLGLTVDSTGIRSPQGINFTIASGTAAIDGVMGLSTAAGTSSTDGVLATPGDRLFIDSSEKQDVLTTLATFSEAMKAYDGTQTSRQSLSDIVDNTLNNLNNVQTSVLEVTAKIGARFNTLESTRELHLDTELVSQEILSELRDIDYAEAATRLSAQSLILQAAQSSFVRVSQLTLFSQL